MVPRVSLQVWVLLHLAAEVVALAILVAVVALVVVLPVKSLAVMILQIPLAGLLVVAQVLPVMSLGAMIIQVHLAGLFVVAQVLPTGSQESCPLRRICLLGFHYAVLPIHHFQAQVNDQHHSAETHQQGLSADPVTPMTSDSDLDFHWQNSKRLRNECPRDLTSSNDKAASSFQLERSTANVIYIFSIT